MPLSALALVVLAGFIHACWNIAAKKAGGDVRFIAFTSVVLMVFWAPLGLWVGWAQVLAWGLLEWGLVLSSALLHIVYFILLLRGYRQADLTVVYPFKAGAVEQQVDAADQNIKAQRPLRCKVGRCHARPSEVCTRHGRIETPQLTLQIRGDGRERVVLQSRSSLQRLCLTPLHGGGHQQCRDHKDRHEGQAPKESRRCKAFQPWSLGRGVARLHHSTSMALSCQMERS